MLQRLFGYVKGDDQSIDRMASTLKQMGADIYDLAPEARLSDISMASIIMNYCQGEEYNMAKYTLSHVDVLTSALAVEQLRNVEQNVQKDRSNFIHSKGNRGGRQGRRGRISG